jgi:hypothetical protein
LNAGVKGFDSLIEMDTLQPMQKGMAQKRRAAAHDRAQWNSAGSINADRGLRAFVAPHPGPHESALRRRKAARTLCVVLVLMLAATGAFAQVPARAWKIADGFADYDQDPIAEITRLYFAGDWESLQRETMRVLRNLRFKPVNESGTDDISFRFDQHFYFVVLVYKTPDRNEEVLRFLVHEPFPDPYVLRLPGIKAGDDRKLYEVYLASDPKDALISTYVSTRQHSELESQLPKFFKEFDPKVLEDLLLAVPPRNRTHAVLGRVDLPFARASVQVKDVVLRGERELTETFKVLNRPLNRFSLGVISSLIVSSAESDARATIQSGDLAPDPLRGHMPMAVLNIHPVAYDDEADVPSWSERFRLFVGGVLAPEFGISAGLGIQLIRGFSVNAGAAVLLIDTLKPGETIGAEPLDPEDPFEYGTATVFFAGVGYNF